MVLMLWVQDHVAEKFFRNSFLVWAFYPLCCAESARIEKTRQSRHQTGSRLAWMRERIWGDG